MERPWQGKFAAQAPGLESLHMSFMDKHQVDIPLDVQLEAICFPSLTETWEFILPYLPELKGWDPRRDSQESFRQTIRDHIGIDNRDLISYLRSHPEKCRILLMDSYNKHHSPATFIEEFERTKYRVGWSGAGRGYIRVFSALAEATADYVLFSWGLPRLSKQQAGWS